MNDFVFKEGPNGLELVGDFEGLYRSEPDPWHQAGNFEDNRAAAMYYVHSRARLCSIVRTYASLRGSFGLEIGCGHGHVVDILNRAVLRGNGFWDGMDISPTAIVTANQKYPRYRFFQGDITKPKIYLQAPIRGYDAVILGQMLWYVLDHLDEVIENCYYLVKQGGVLILSQAFLTSPQRYGRNIVDGFAGTVKLFVTGYQHQFRLIDARYDDQGGFTHNDGVLVLRKV